MPQETASPEAIIEFSGPEPQALTHLAADYPEEIVLIRAKSLSAFEYTLQALVVVVPLTVRLLSPIIRAHIEAKRHIRLKIDGTEIDGLDADGIIRVLRELSDLSEPK